MTIEHKSSYSKIPAASLKRPGRENFFTPLPTIHEDVPEEESDNSNQSHYGFKLMPFKPSQSDLNFELLSEFTRKNPDLKTIINLIDMNADINITNGDGNSLLELAIFKNRIDIVELLVGSGIDINSKDRFGIPIFWLVLNNSSLEMKYFFVKNGVNLSATDKYGKTALMYALELGIKSNEIFLKANGAKK